MRITGGHDMNNSNNSRNSKKLDTNFMQEQLKGDVFPENGDVFLDDSVKEFFDELLKTLEKKKSDIIRKANLPREYGYQIMEGRRRGKRDYYILIAIAMGLDLKTTQRMLAVTNCGALHALIKRDAAIIFAINHNYDIYETYEFMSALELNTLDDGT